MTNHYLLNFLGAFPKISDGSQALNVKVSLRYHPSLPCWHLAESHFLLAIAFYCIGRGIFFQKLTWFKFWIIKWCFPINFGVTFSKLDNWNVSNKWIVRVFSITFIISEIMEIFVWHFDCIPTIINCLNVIVEIKQITMLTNTHFYLVMETIRCYEYMSFFKVFQCDCFHWDLWYW